MLQIYRCALTYIILSLLIIPLMPVHAQSSPLALNQRIADHIHLLSSTQRQTLSVLSQQLEATTGTQLVVMIVNSTQPDSIEEYAIKVFEAAKIGQQQIDNGILILIAIQDRQLRIEVGYGLEGVISDAHSRRIIQHIMQPYFQQGDYFSGIYQAMQALSNLATKEFPATPSHQLHSSTQDHTATTRFKSYFIIIIISNLASILLTAILNRITGFVALVVLSILIAIVSVFRGNTQRLHYWLRQFTQYQLKQLIDDRHPTVNYVDEKNKNISAQSTYMYPSNELYDDPLSRFYHIASLMTLLLLNSIFTYALLPFDNNITYLLIWFLNLLLLPISFFTLTAILPMLLAQYRRNQIYTQKRNRYRQSYPHTSTQSYPQNRPYQNQANTRNTSDIFRGGGGRSGGGGASGRW